MKPYDCKFCFNPCDDTFYRVTGWAERRAQGGAHGIIDRQETGEYACGRCIKDIQMGITPGSPSLFT